MNIHLYKLHRLKYNKVYYIFCNDRISFCDIIIYFNDLKLNDFIKYNSIKNRLLINCIPILEYSKLHSTHCYDRLFNLLKVNNITYIYRYEFTHIW